MTDENRLAKRLRNNLVRSVKDASGKTVALESADGKLRLGAIGEVMNPGPKGDAGSTGAQGLKGEQGDAGPAGAIGQQGPSGAPGSDGARGDSGGVGQTGPQGLTGATGLAGATGPRGPAGDTGPAGGMGLQGARGETGQQGPVGAAGPAGAIGPAGEIGPAGAIGPAGSQGLKGDTGAAGPAGAAGTAGTKVQAIRVQTDAAGKYTWTFPTAFVAGVLPVIQITVQDASSATFNHKVTALSNTAVTIQLVKTTAVTVVGVSVLGMDTSPQAFVHLMVVAP